MKLRKKYTERLTQEIADILQEHGGKPSVGWHDYTIQSKCGPLNVKIDINPGDEVATVFCRFGNVESARQIVRCNPHTGKWNFHVWASEAEWLPSMIESSLNRIIEP